MLCPFNRRNLQQWLYRNVNIALRELENNSLSIEAVRLSDLTPLCFIHPHQFCTVTVKPWAFVMELGSIRNISLWVDRLWFHLALNVYSNYIFWGFFLGGGRFFFGENGPRVDWKYCNGTSFNSVCQTLCLCDNLIIGGSESHLSSCFQLFASKFWKVVGTYE